MTVAELIAKLSELPPGLPVCVIGQGGLEGFTVDLTGIKQLDALRRNKNYLRPPREYYVTTEEYAEEDLNDFQKDDGGERTQIIQLS